MCIRGYQKYQVEDIFYCTIAQAKIIFSQRIALENSVNVGICALFFFFGTSLWLNFDKWMFFISPFNIFSLLSREQRFDSPIKELDILLKVII